MRAPEKLANLFLSATKLGKLENLLGVNRLEWSGHSLILLE